MIMAANGKTRELFKLARKLETTASVSKPVPLPTWIYSISIASTAKFGRDGRRGLLREKLNQPRNNSMSRKT
jgi:hypothetical protein